MISVSDLRIVVVDCITALEGDGGVRKLLAALLAQLQSMRQDANAEKAARKTASHLVNRMRSVSPGTWPSGRREAFKRLGAWEVLGPGGADEIESILPDFGYKHGHVERVVQKLIQDADNLTVKLQSAVPVLKATDAADQPNAAERLRLLFRDGMDIKDLDTLEREVRRWKRIISGLERFAGQSPADIKIFDIRSGTLVIELTVGASAILSLVFWAARSALQILTKVEHLKQTRASTALHGKLVDAAVKSLDEASRQLIAEAPKVILDDISKRIAAEILPGAGAQPAEPEAFQAGKNAAEELVEFTERGGRVAVIGGDESRGAELEALNDKLESARLDLQKIVAIDYKEPSD